MSLIASDFLWAKQHFSREHIGLALNVAAANRKATGITESEYYALADLAGLKVRPEKKRHKKRK